ncbi:50S ribosomal protein L3 [Gaeumannomyces tritici R3-111a-1]|uniref:Large ribosomal subunit protein uL3m n=1 Tax=Gaeumannomyces tritici (strain R3-111a-1) TaxID=644352 RepID=J3NZT2_GAET3|nr:50S ribosomal protein L3 [Gaeumannomyces tritici R3-111a-1]EJT76865.1 50S ribosomal protein L3 [Gaeumannomyces tritici R3-111a-1]
MAPRLPARGWSGLLPQLCLHHPTPTLATTTTNPSALAGGAPLLVAARTPTSLLLLPRTAKRGVKYGWSTLPKRAAKPTRFNQQTAGIPAPTTGPAAALKRRERTTPVRSGVLAVKKGMTAFYTRRGTRIPCTVLQLEAVQVLQSKTREHNGYWAVQVGAGPKRPATVPAPQLGYFEAKGVEPKQHVAEFKVRGPEGLLPVGVQLMPDWFHIGQWVDVRGTSRGMGFAGGMKRHGFSGQPASHGNSLNHRTIGSAGPSQGSGSRVLPGKKMPGRMGGESATVQNMAVLRVDNDLGIVVVKGPVAGPKGGLVKIQDAVKKPPPPENWVRSSREAVLSRRPNHGELLEAARRRHLELKEERKSGRIGELVAQHAPNKEPSVEDLAFEQIDEPSEEPSEELAVA